MNEATGRWLHPLSDAMRVHDPTGKTAGRLFDAATMPGAQSGKALNVFESYALEEPGARHVAIDWIRYGQLIREELMMYEYPEVPPDFFEDNCRGGQLRV